MAEGTVKMPLDTAQVAWVDHINAFYLRRQCKSKSTKLVRGEYDEMCFEKVNEKYMIIHCLMWLRDIWRECFSTM